MFSNSSFPFPSKSDSSTADIKDAVLTEHRRSLHLAESSMNLDGDEGSPSYNTAIIESMLPDLWELSASVRTTPQHLPLYPVPPPSAPPPPRRWEDQVYEQSAGIRPKAFGDEVL